MLYRDTESKLTSKMRLRQLKDRIGEISLDLKLEAIWILDVAEFLC